MSEAVCDVQMLAAWLQAGDDQPIHDLILGLGLSTFCPLLASKHVGSLA